MTAKKLARGVAVAGVGMSKFGVFPDKSSRDLFVEAYQELRSTVEKDYPPRILKPFIWETSALTSSRNKGISLRSLPAGSASRRLPACAWKTPARAAA
jgi:hypothetical protein